MNSIQVSKINSYLYELCNVFPKCRNCSQYVWQHWCAQAWANVFLGLSSVSNWNVSTPLPATLSRAEQLECQRTSVTRLGEISSFGPLGKIN
jgi:hypothetical protein